jgi:2-polyprenyl-3-methyl-5-hydroxy-6-metoxy-1,4-benzoquinol methylase
MNSSNSESGNDRSVRSGRTLNKQGYHAIAAAWDAARISFHGREGDYLNGLLDGLDAPARVLDLGCGTGRPIAEHILSREHRLTGVDQAEALLEIACKRFPSATWIQGEIEVDAFDAEERFHAIVCWDTLFHIEHCMMCGFSGWGGRATPVRPDEQGACGIASIPAGGYRF